MCTNIRDVEGRDGSELKAVGLFTPLETTSFGILLLTIKVCTCSIMDELRHS
jgi:hypothetical protein